ncbi:MAG TPA: hypothetical protein VGI39_27935 [Polyangiaceae bacterium]
MTRRLAPLHAQPAWGLSKHVVLKSVRRQELASGTVATRYVPT